MNDNIFGLLISTSFTSSQLHRRATLIKSFYEKYIYGGSKPKPQDFFTNPLDWQWFLTYQSPLYQALSSPIARNDLADLDTKLGETIAITCFTAISIPEDRIEPLISSLRQELGPNVILEMRVDPTIVGGCVIIYKGQVKDYTIRNKIAAQKAQILNAFQEAVTK